MAKGQGRVAPGIVANVSLEKEFAGRASGRRIEFRCRLVENCTLTARLADFLEPRRSQYRRDR